MKKYTKCLLCLSLLCCMVFLGSTVSAEAKTEKGRLSLNEKLIEDVMGGGDYLYSFEIKDQGLLTISGDFNSNTDGWIKILDSNGNELINDHGHWAENNLTGKKNLSMTLQINKGKYYLELVNNSESKIYSVNIDIGYNKIANVTSKKKLSGSILRDGMAIFLVKMGGNGKLNFKGDFYDHYSLSIYICDSNGVIIDQDNSKDGDWIEDKVSGLWKMNFTTNTLLKGNYYIKIDNQQKSSLDYSLKFSIDIPATQLIISKSEITLKQGETTKISTKVTPKKSTDILTWTSSNKNIVEVDKKGVLTAKETGTTTITVKTTSGIKKSVKVTVTK